MTIPSLKISFSKSDRKEILNGIDKCLENGQISQGENVRILEQDIAEFTDVPFAVAMNSATSVIEATMRILGVKGKEVLVPTNTFLATASGVINAGGTVKLMDLDPRTFSVTLDEVKRRVTNNTVGVIVVHIGGIISPEIEKISQWCEDNNLWLFEDASHAVGSTYMDKHPGSFGIAAAYSFFATKIITSGEGGVLVTRDAELADAARIYRNHGKPKEWETLHTCVGDNNRMSDITAVIAVNQIKKLNYIIDKRSQIADYYLKNLDVLCPYLKVIQPLERSGWDKFIVLLPKGINQQNVKRKMKERGISLQGEVYSIPLHKQPIASRLGFVGDYPVADDISTRHICLPIYPSLSEKEVEYICRSLVEILNE